MINLYKTYQTRAISIPIFNTFNRLNTSSSMFTHPFILIIPYVYIHLIVYIISYSNSLMRSKVHVSLTRRFPSLNPLNSYLYIVHVRLNLATHSSPFLCFSSPPMTSPFLRSEEHTSELQSRGH